MLKRLFNDPFSRLVLRMCVIFVVAFVAIRFLGLRAFLPMLAIAVYGAFSGKNGMAMLAFTMISVISMMNPLVLPRPQYFSMVARLASVAISGALVAGATQRQGNNRPPLGLLLLFLVTAFVSSIQGYYPPISYLKIINFALFVVGVVAGVSNIDRQKDEITLLRAGFIALGAIYVWGSIATIPFPAVAYLTSLANRINMDGMAAARDAFRAAGGDGLFAGISCQSQFLGPCLGCVFGLVACDMLMLERRASPIHILVMLPIPVLMAMTKSRIGLVTFLSAVVFLSIWLIPKIHLSPKDKRRIKDLARLFVGALIILSITAEVRHSTVSRLLRKTNNIASDERTLVEAFTNSRMGVIWESMQDFRRNPIWGKGFQVDSTFEYKFKGHRGLVFSASIEKGVLPTMILGETGIVGAMMFLVFLWVFYSTCAKRGYYATMLLFSTLLASNMGEATFFSPSGAGGVFWLICVAGGFTIDMARKNLEAHPSAAMGTAPLNPFRRTRIQLEAIAP
ncbi:MAG: O-antigen ligase family protein [Kiritimatiellae bacterium]|nr:O-antigen ligase family protein [Kiritimatiellia bacterium]